MQAGTAPAQTAVQSCTPHALQTADSCRLMQDLSTEQEAALRNHVPGTSAMCIDQSSQGRADAISGLPGHEVALSSAGNKSRNSGAASPHNIPVTSGKPMLSV